MCSLIKYMENENLIEKVPEDITADGQPIWMAF